MTSGVHVRGKQKLIVVIYCAVMKMNIGDIYTAFFRTVECRHGVEFVNLDF